MAETNTSKKSAFEILNAINVNEHTEIKDTGKVKLTYLSWTWAWAEVKKAYPEANYEIVKFDGIPYAYDPNTGYMVYTKVTIEGITHEMWLPVMDGNNRAMKAEPYEVKTKYNTFTVQPATMFDVNKTIMRCLVKNLAMFGLGLYIYAGEDIPDSSDVPSEAPTPTKKAAPVITCADCGEPIKGCKVKDKNGVEKTVSAQGVADETERRYGRRLCRDCAHKETEKLKAQKEEMKPEEPKMEIDETTGLPFPV